MRVISQSTEGGDVFDMARVLDRVKSPDRVLSLTAEVAADRVRSVPLHLGEEDAVDEGDVKSDKWPLPGFAPMTRISTSFGEVHAVALRKGDLLRTARGEFKPIVWLDRVVLDDRFLSGLPDAHPIKITADAFGRGLPKVDVMLSPRQTLSVNARLSIGASCEAAALLNRPGIFRQPETGLSYTMFHLGEPADVICEGLAVHIEP